MKKILLILLLLSSVFLNAQYYKDSLYYQDDIYLDYQHIDTDKKFPEWAKVLIIYCASITLDAVGDGLRDAAWADPVSHPNYSKWGHVCNAGSTALLLSTPFILNVSKKNWGYYAATYVCLRVSMFDYTYNATRGLPLGYRGGNSTWDKSIKKWDEAQFAFARSIFFTAGIIVPIQNLNGKKRDLF